MMFALSQDLCAAVDHLSWLAGFGFECAIDDSDKALPWIIKNVLPPGLSGLMFVAVIAALQSSLDHINATSLMVTRDIRHVLFKQHDPARDLVVGRWISLMLLLSAMVIAPFISDGGIFVFIQTGYPCSRGPCWHCCYRVP